MEGGSSFSPPTFGKKTFAEILSIAALGKAIPSTPELQSSDKPTFGLHKGKPSVFISRPKKEEYSAPYRCAVVGKFSQGRPTLEDLHSYLVSLDLKSEFQLGLLDSRHVIINFRAPEDYHRIFSKSIWYIGKFVMRVFKWTTRFHVDRESSIVPVWIELEKLPIFLFNREALFAIASRVGIPLRLDSATQEIRKPSVARIQVELDLLKPRPDMIWIDIEEEDGFWQKIKYGSLPAYCDFCWHLGHDSNSCHVKNPSLKALEPLNQAVVKTIPSQTINQVYRVKASTNNTAPEQAAQQLGETGHTVATQENQPQFAAKEQNSVFESAEKKVEFDPTKDNHTDSLVSEIKEPAAINVPVLVDSPISNKEDSGLNNPPDDIHLTSNAAAFILKDDSTQNQEVEKDTCSEIYHQNPFSALHLISEENLNTSDVVNEIVQQVYFEAASEHIQRIADEVVNDHSHKPQSLEANIDWEVNKIINEGNLSPRKRPNICTEVHYPSEVSNLVASSEQMEDDEIITRCNQIIKNGHLSPRKNSSALSTQHAQILTTVKPKKYKFINNLSQ